jgi:hypothetical protein
MVEITLLDYILLPFYLLLIYKIAYYYRDKYYPEGHPYRPYFITGLSVKICGAILIGLIYCYYYKGGDTFGYFLHCKIINSTFADSPDTWLRLITHTADSNNAIDMQAVTDMYWYDDTAAYTTSCLGAFIGVFCLTKYLIINVIIASVTFIGMWLMFITFATQYKHLVKYIAVAVLFMPSTIMWGSGLFKDSFCMFSIGCLVYSMHVLFEKRTLKLSLVLLSLISIGLLILIKAYIIIVLLPVMVLKIILVYKRTLSGHPTKKIIFYVALLIMGLITLFIFKRVAGYLSTFTIDNVLKTIIIQKNYLLRVSIETDGSAYDLGDFDPSINGLLSKALPAINVTLFRPYPWETKSIIQFFSSLESTAILLLTLYMIFKRNIFKTIKNIYTDPNLIMCILFSLIFAFFVGISSYNFGTLSRYKIPCTPFYMLFLMILIFNKKSEEKISAIIDRPYQSL